MSLPYKLATLLYCFNSRDEVLLLERAQEPNLGLWSPCGGRVPTGGGECPCGCACREAQEELGVTLQPSELHLTGLVSEHGYQGQSHWLMFLFEVKARLTALPEAHREGRFGFFARNALAGLKLPQTDSERIWPWFWEHRGGFFAAHCHCREDGTNECLLEESRAERRGARGRVSSPRPPTLDPFPQPRGQPMTDGPIIHLQSDHYFMSEALRQAPRAVAAD